VAIFSKASSEPLSHPRRYHRDADAIEAIDRANLGLARQGSSQESSTKFIVHKKHIKKMADSESLFFGLIEDSEI
jgi:hypothetical protein